MGRVKEIDRMKLARLREATGLNMSQLAKRAGVAKTTYINIEDGTTKNPNRGSLEKIAKALGVEVAELEHEAVGTTLALLNVSMADVAAVLKEARQLMGDDQEGTEDTSLLQVVSQMAERNREDNQQVLESNKAIAESNRLVLEANRGLQEVSSKAIDSMNERRRAREAARYRQDVMAFANIMVARLDALARNGSQLDENTKLEAASTLKLVKGMALSIQEAKPKVTGEVLEQLEGPKEAM